MENKEMMDKTLYLMVCDSLPEESKKAISELWDTGINNSGVWVRFGNVEATIGKVIWPFRNYTVDMEVLKQVQWERDIALEQLREIGKSLGEKMDDVAEAIKNNSDASNSTVFTTSIGWIHRTVCPKCGWSIEEAWTSKYCPDCGAKMNI